MKNTFFHISETEQLDRIRHQINWSTSL